MKAFIKSWRALTRQAGPILLFDGEVGPLKPARHSACPAARPWRAPPNRYP